MDSKTASSLEKILGLKHKKNYSKAIEKISELIEKNPQESQIYIEAVDLCLEAGESLKAWNIFKKAASANSECQNQVWGFAKERVKSQNDPVLAKLLMEQAIRKRDLESGRQVIYNLENHTAKELLKRTRVKKKTLIASLNGDYSLKGDLLINIFSEALLLLRVGRTKESIQTFVHILDEKPIENDVIETFLVQLEKSISSNSSIHYALGCSYLISEQFRKALANFNQSIHINHAFLSNCIERIEQLRKSNHPLPEDLDLVLAEAYLMQGDSIAAAGLLMDLLDNQPGKAAIVLDLTGRFMTGEADSFKLRFAYVEAAILAKQNTRAVNQIAALFEDQDHTDATLAWLEQKYLDHLLPSDILMQYGAIALQREMYDKAASVLADVAEMSPVDVPAVCRLLEEHQEHNQTIRELWTSLSAQLGSNRSDDPGIEHFERSDFSFSSMRSGPAARPAPDPVPHSASPPEAVEAMREDPVPAGRDLRFDPNTVELPSVSGDIEEPAGAADGAGDASTAIPLSYDAAEECPAPEEETAAPFSAESFGERFRVFLDGSMDDDEVISLIDDAFTEGEDDKLPQLLSFKPNGLEEDLQRKLQLTRYYLLKDSPLEALAAIKSIAIDTVPGDAKKDVLLKLAACYRRIHMYEAAHSALLKFKCEYPDSSVIDRLLKHNYSDYLKQQCSGAQLLEKTGKLE